MNIIVNGIFIYDDVNFAKNHLTDKVYEQTVALANIEVKIAYHNCTDQHGRPEVVRDFNSLFNRCMQIIAAIEQTNENINRSNNPIETLKHRINFNFESNLQKQIFINNFIFSDNEKFIQNLKTYGITKEQIENLIKAIIRKKKVAVLSNNYQLDIKDIFDIESIIKHYSFSKYGPVINKIYELYYKFPELINTLDETKKR